MRLGLVHAIGVFVTRPNANFTKFVSWLHPVELLEPRYLKVPIICECDREPLAPHHLETDRVGKRKPLIEKALEPSRRAPNGTVVARGWKQRLLLIEVGFRSWL